MKPSRQEIEAAINTVNAWTDGLQDADGMTIEVKKLRALVVAARWCLELVDFDNPPLLPEDLERMKPRFRSPPKRRR